MPDQDLSPTFAAFLGRGNSDGIGRPPPSLKRSGWPGTAWQEEPPPALKVVSPFAGFGV